jgi:hypothetical protein
MFNNDQDKFRESIKKIAKRKKIEDRYNKVDISFIYSRIEDIKR